MADNDIYDSEEKYRKFKANLNKLLDPPNREGHRKYYCKNKENLKYFHKLFEKFEARDVSYIRRLRLFRTLIVIVYVADKDLKDLEREDVDRIVAFMHSTYKSPKTKSDFIRDMKHMWKLLLPEKDERGRSDENIVPYVVRHLTCRIDKSKEKMRADKLMPEEFDRILTYFSKDPRIQFFLSLSLESIARPQEILYRRIKDVKIYDNYAAIEISDHGKEGIGIMQCIDSYPFLVKWLDQHPFKNNPNEFLFINLGKRNFGKQLKPTNVNEQIRKACKHLGINKPVTCYSLKRNGITFRRLRGESDVEIQHAARWTSTEPLKIYDMSTQEDVFKIQLIKKGLINSDDSKYKKYIPQNKLCNFCGKLNSFVSKFCDLCKRPLNRLEVVFKEKSKEAELELLKEEVIKLKGQIELRKPYEEIIEKFFENQAAKELFVKITANNELRP